MLHSKKMPFKIKISENQNPFMGLSYLVGLVSPNVRVTEVRINEWTRTTPKMTHKNTFKKVKTSSWIWQVPVNTPIKPRVGQNRWLKCVRTVVKWAMKSSSRWKQERYKTEQKQPVQRPDGGATGQWVIKKSCTLVWPEVTKSPIWNKKYWWVEASPSPPGTSTGAAS